MTNARDAQLLVEFLEYVHLPKQYFIAREYQIVSVLNDLLDLLKRIPEEDQKLKTKQAVFTNIMMKTMGDGRKYIRNIGSMMQNGFFSTYLKEQEKLSSNLKDKLDTFAPETRRDLDEFVRQNEEDADLLTISMDRSLLKAKKQETRNKPSQIVTKSITMLRDVDTRIFDKLTTAEKDKLRDQIDKLSDVIHHFDEAISEDGQEAVHETVSKQVDEGSKRFYIAPRELDEPAVFCREAGKSLSALTFSLLQAQEAIRMEFTSIPAIQPDTNLHRRILKRELQAEALKRLESSARTEQEFTAVTEWWDRLDRNRERRERSYEISRGDVPLEHEMSQDGMILLIR